MSETGGSDTFSVQELVRSVKGEQNGVLERMRHLLEDGTWSDVQFAVGSDPPTMFHAHRLVLASASPPLAALLYGPLAEPGPVKVPDLKPRIFRYLLVYLYTDELSPPCVEDAMWAMRAALKYQLPHMASRCSKYLSGALSPENACGVLEFARDVADQPLAERCLQYVCQHGDAVLKQPSFAAVSPAVLRLVLDQDRLVIASEADVVEAALRWAAEECRRRRLAATPAGRRQVLRDFLPQLRLLTLSPDQLVGVVGLKDVLSPEEYRDLLSHLVRPDSSELPAAICCSDTPRGTAVSAGVPAICAHCRSSLVTTYMGNFCTRCRRAAD